MKEAVVKAGPQVRIIDSAIPKAGPGQVIIKVVFSGSNPKDWKVPEWRPTEETNTGDDIAGTIHELGPGVSEFKVGDRVAAFHEMMTPHGSFAEYALAWAHTTFHLPPSTSFEEGAALPLASMTAALGLYDRLALPQPFLPRADSDKPIPLVIYGASSAIGTYALQFAQRSNIHPLICIAGRAQQHVEALIDRSKGDTIVDYRGGDEAVRKGIKDALKGAELWHAFDGVSEHGSYINIGAAMAKGGHITTVLPSVDETTFPEGFVHTLTHVGAVHAHRKDFGFVYFRLIARGIEEGWFKAQPHEVVSGGLAGVEEGLKNLKSGKASAVKYVFKIADTPGAGQ